MSESQEPVKYKLEGEILEEVKERLEEISKFSDKYRDLKNELDYVNTITKAEEAKLWKFLSQHYPESANLPSHVNKETWELVIGSKDDIDGIGFLKRILGL